jgi:uncharacterized protein with GYD domain
VPGTGLRIGASNLLLKRAAAIKVAAKKMGVKVKEIYWTLGDHDGVLIFEGADDERVTTFLLHIGAMGNVHTTTFRAFTAAEMDQPESRCLPQTASPKR